jgi:hypothetical protein
MGGEGVAISDKEEEEDELFLFLSEKVEKDPHTHPTQDIMPGTLSSPSRSNTQSE